MFKQNILLFKQFIIDLPPEYLNCKISMHSDDTTLQMQYKKIRNRNQMKIF